MKAALNAGDETFQLEVCSSYNLHAEEEFKLRYWRTALVDILPAHQGDFKTFRFSPDSLRHFWRQNVNASYTLVGLNAILGAIVDSGDAWLKRDIESKLSTYFNPSFTRSLFKYFSFKTSTLLGNEDEVIIKPVVERIARGILKEVASTENSKFSVILTENEVAEKIPAETASPEFLVSLVFLFLLEHFGASAFETKTGRAVKVALTGRRADGVTLEERAKIAQKEALIGLEGAERDLEKKIKVAEMKCHENLSLGRKNLALNFLREKKLLEGKMLDLHQLRLKLAESQTLGDTAKIQQMVVETLKSSATAVIKEEISSTASQAEKLACDMQEISESVSAIKEVFSEAHDPDLEAEFENLRVEANLSRLPKPPTLIKETHERLLA